MFRNMCSYIASSYQEARDFDGFKRDAISILGCESPINETQFYQDKEEEITEKLYELSYPGYKNRILKMAEKVMPIIHSVFEKEGQRYENIAIPITDEKKTLQIVANLKRCVENGAREVALTIEKNLTLAIIDDAWKEHLREMDDLKQSVQNASYEQKDPLLIYKFESYDLFSRMVTSVYKDVVSFLNNGQIPIRDPQNVREAQLPSSDRNKLKTGREEVSSQQTSEPQITQPIKVEKKVGRNNTCPCGSGKKYKNCHGRE